MKPIFVALDTPDLDRALELARAVRKEAGGVKLGLEFFSSQGPAGVERVQELGLPVFLDLKLHDIPNTVAKAVEALSKLAPKIMTVHAAGGHEMLSAARDAAPPETKIVAVTMLTSLDAGDLIDLGIEHSPAEHVERLAWIARDAGLDGIVCSGSEVGQASAAWPNGFFVVPGIRPAGGTTGDQKRVSTARRALDEGASVLVIGRPITAAADPAAAIQEIAASLSQKEEEARI